MQNRVKITYTYCLDYIDSKEDKFTLTLEDLLYLSNFKWWGGTIQESPVTLKEKLKHFSDKFKSIDKLFNMDSLYTLSENRLQKLMVVSNDILLDCLSNSPYKIAWIWASYMSALLHLYFQKLCPIIDRNILLGLDLIENVSIDSQWQVKNIHLFYNTLIQKTYLIQKDDPSKSIKDIDDTYFEIGQRKWKNIQKLRK
jgi:hypothetical protein